MPGVLGVYTADDLADYGTFKCIVPFKNRDGSEMKKPARCALARRQGSLRRRSGRLRGRGDACAGARCRRSGRARYRSAAGGDARKRSGATRRAAALSTTCRTMSRSIIIIGDSEKVAAAFESAAHVTQAVASQHPSGCRRDGAARGGRRIRCRERTLHAACAEPGRVRHEEPAGRHPRRQAGTRCTCSPAMSAARSA